MKQPKKCIRDCLMTCIIISFTFAVSLLFQDVFNIPDHITTVFIFAVFIISLLTEGYLYGIAASILGTIAINYAFTFPFFKFSLSLPENLISALIMLFISIFTGTLTTKIKKSEMIRLESEKERMRANLLRAVSHDLRTPLTTIYGSSSALIENSSTFSEDKKEKMLLGIKEDSEWLMSMVENLLSITRIDSGNVKLIKTPTVLDELADSVINKFNKRHPNCTVILDIPEEVVIIPMDPLLIQQVILNIFENAVIHGEDTTAVTFKVTSFSGTASFEIYDNGCGIPSEKLPTLFSGAGVSERTTSDGQKRNSGIGLSVCASIINAHGGEISAKNLPSRGALFKFTLATDDTEAN